MGWCIFCALVSPDAGAGLGPLHLSTCLCRFARCHFIFTVEARSFSIPTLVCTHRAALTGLELPVPLASASQVPAGINGPVLLHSAMPGVLTSSFSFPSLAISCTNDHCVPGSLQVPGRCRGSNRTVSLPVGLLGAPGWWGGCRAAMKCPAWERAWAQGEAVS